MPAKVVARAGLDFTAAEKLLTEAGVQLVPAPLWSEEDIIRHAADAEAVIAALQGQWPPVLVNPEVKERKNRRIG